MNTVVLIGRLIKDPETRYTAGTQLAVTTFTLAVDRLTKPGEEKKADFPRVIVFGKQAENCERYLGKGRRVAVHGRIQTDKYTNQNGATVYTTDVIADRVEFLDSANKQETAQAAQEPAPQGFATLDEDIPF